MNELFQALSDPTRREIIRLLRAGDKTAGEIAAAFPLAKSTLSGHFNVLKHAGLIVAERSGTTIYYSLNTSTLEDIVAAVMDLVGAGERHDEPERHERAAGEAAGGSSLKRPAKALRAGQEE